MSYYSYIPLDIGIIISVLTALPPIIFNLAEYFQKSQVKLKIIDAQFMAKGFDHNYVGYQLKALLINKGKKICLDLDDVSVVIEDTKGNTPSLLKVNKKIMDNHREITLDKEQMRDIGHCWIDKKDRLITSLQEMRQDDPFYLVFPYKTNWGGYVSKEEKTFLSSSHSHEYLLDLKNEKYSVEIKVKGEDSDSNTITKKASFKIKPPINKFTTTKDTEIGGLTSQINELQHKFSRKESEVSSLTKKIIKLEDEKTELESNISKKIEEIEELVTQKEKSDYQLDQANDTIRKLRRDVTELQEKYEILRKAKQEPKRVK